MARLPGVVPTSIGDTVRLHVDPADVCVFDAATGRRVERTNGDVPLTLPSPRKRGEGARHGG
jgi:hypothetical protein